jgi:hypothetical protein
MGIYDDFPTPTNFFFINQESGIKLFNSRLKCPRLFLNQIIVDFVWIFLVPIVNK